MHRSFLFRFFILGLTLAVSSVFAYKPILRSVDILSVRQMGMGQAYTAIANDETLLQANPAGIGVRKMFQLNKEDSLFYFLPFKFGFSHSIYKGLTTGSFEEVFNPVGNQVNGSIDFGSLGDFVYAGDFWAISLFNRGVFNVFNTSGGDDFYYQVQLLSQFNLGFRVYSFSFLSEKDFHVGVSGKISYSIQSERGLGYEEMYNKYTDLRDGNIGLQTLIDIFGEVMNVYEGFSLGIDIGVLWEIPIRDTEHQINLGFMLEDAPTYAISVSLLTDSLWKFSFIAVCTGYFSAFPVGNADDLCSYPEGVGPESTFLIPNAKVGVAYMLPDYFGNYFRDTLFALDFHRIGDPDYDFTDSYHVGFSTSIFDFTDKETGRGYRMNIGLGINQGQFNGSVLFHLKVYEISYNYFKKKVVKTNHMEDRHVITFAFYF